MAENLINIEGFDCLPFNSIHATPDILQHFIETQTQNIFYFATDRYLDNESKIAEYDYRSQQWCAGRFIGEAIFEYKGKQYKITIKPRFGEHSLFRMLEEIFNIRITKSISENRDQDWQHYIKRIIAFIWLQKLANANLHGLPKMHSEKQNKGYTIKGKLSIRKSVNSINRSGEVVSINREKQIDATIAKIILDAYLIVKSDFANGQINIPDSAQEAINQISSTTLNLKPVEERDYKAIRYKEIYLSWKLLVDFSWDIIKRKRLGLKQNQNKKSGFGFFIDMAEVWEQYLKSILKKGLMPYGWHLRNEKIFAYTGYFFSRELIPDLVFQKCDNIVIWDAKYKRMYGRKIDVDRSDFFQIHTYIQHFLNHKNVKSGGLLYPLSRAMNPEKIKSPFLMTEDGFKTSFCIDGIELNEILEDKQQITNSNQIEQEKKLVMRLLSYIN